jgi:cellulose synthase/poly-beta-1,6-N-acetylglucosamine synthase-like glycosyltransferase
MIAVAIVPYRLDASGNRRINAEAVLTWLSGLKIRVILSEHADFPDNELRVPVGVIRIFTESTGAFNKARACNRGFLASTENVIALVDADTLMDSRTFSAALNRVDAHDEVMRPFSRLIELSEDQRNAYLQSTVFPQPTQTDRDDARDGDVIPLCGGIVIMKRDRYFSVGGLDDRFEGWGGEDDALSHALVRTGATIKVVKNEPAFHLWHDREIRSRIGHVHYQRNVGLVNWWQESSEEDLAAHISLAQSRLSTESRQN